MKNSSKGIMGKVCGVSGAILISRILGLFRVRLEAEVLGGGAVASAWHFAFTFPNVLRRLFGEGALGNALMPIVAELDTKYGRESVKGALAVVFPCLGALLGGIVILCSLIALILGNCLTGTGEEGDRWRLVFILTPLLMPYTIFICLTGVMTAVLNYARCFILPAFYSLSMNIFLVGGLLWGWYSKADSTLPELKRFLVVLSLLFLISGIVQFVLMVIQLKIVNFSPDFSSWRQHTGVLKKLYNVALPGIIGGAAVQASFFLDRNLAHWVNEQGVSALTYVERLIDLPIGMFGVAMGQVIMARMTASAAAGDLEELRQDMNNGLRQLWFCTIPLGAGVIFFHELLLKVICLGGRYTMNDLDAARQVAIFYGCGIPFFCALKIILPAFFARKDMRTPLFASLTAIAANVILSLALIKCLAQGGIALATSCSSGIHCILLAFFLKKAGVGIDLKKTGLSLIRALFAAAAAGVSVKLLLDRFYHGSGRLADIAALAAVGGLFGVIYLVCSFVTGSREISEVLSRFRKKNA